MFKKKKYILICALFMVLLCCLSAVSASEDVTDDVVSVSDEVAVDEVVSEVDSGDGSIATEDDESLESVDDSGNESLAVQDVEQVDDVDNTTLTAENENESDVNDTNSTLTAEVDDELSGQTPNEIHIPDGTTFAMDTFSNGDTTYYLNGTYHVNGIVFLGIDNPQSNQPRNNICIKPEIGANATVIFEKSQSSIAVIMIPMGENITIENIKFTTTSNYASASGSLNILGQAKNIIFKNCTFENFRNADLSQQGCAIFNLLQGNLPLLESTVVIDHCKFINCTLNKNIYVQDAKLVNLSNCIFEKNTVKTSEIVSQADIYLKNNQFDSVNPIIIENNGKIVSDVSFNVLTESLTVNEAGSIVAELVDDNGNHIKSAYLKFIVNDEEKTPTFIPATGLYTFEITPSDTSDIKVSAVCSNVETFDVESIYIKVSKPSSNLTLGDDITFDYGESGSTTVSYEGATDVVAEVVNNTATIKIENGNITISGLDAGNYTLKVTTVADDNHANVTKTVNITVNKVDATINLNNITLGYGSSNSTTVTGEGIESITAFIEGQADKVTVSGNTVTVSGLNAGNYTLKVTVTPDKNHNAVETTAKVTVNKVDATINLNNIIFDYGSSNSTTVTGEGIESITAFIEGQADKVTVSGNTVTVSGLNAGNYTLKVTAIPDENHNAVETTAKVTVNKVDATINLNNIIFDYGSSNSTTVTGEGIKNFTAFIEGQADKVTVSGNTVTVSGLNAGNYTLKVTAIPDENHNAVETTAKVAVNKVDSVIDIRNPVVYVYGNVGQCDVYTEGAVNFTARIVNHTEAIISISENGIVNVSGLSAGKYVLEVTTNPDKNHLSVTSSVNVTVSKVDSQITIPNIVFDYGATGNATVTVVGATGINASVLNHTEAVVNIVNNTITVSGLAAGSYVLQATTIPDGNHNPVTATANITVNGVEVPADKSISTNVPANTKSPTFSIKLEKDATGTFTVNIDNGKIVKTAELKDGAASITVADLAAGDHKISISYSGDGNYAPITQNTTLTIKAPAVVKKATKIVAKKKTFKAKVKVKKYTITLKSGKTLLKKVKVTLKVKGKTYKATTNNKGKATFKIKNLKKKGTYNAVIKFKGNKNYKASSKKVKIKVKK